MTEDDDLKTRFAELRREDERRAPDYHSLRSIPNRLLPERESGGPLRGWLPGLSVAFASAAVAAFWFLILHESVVEDAGRSTTSEWAMGPWAMPTDVLLDLSTLPGDDLLYEVPEIGTLPVPKTSEGARHESSNRRIPA